ncbi:MAG: LysR family transcriptional regulator [Dehalococcoidia bacterium]
MDMAELETFVAVCRMGSFTAAARERRMTQPGVSRHIQRLEHALGVRLMERGARGIAITTEGQRLLEYAEEALARQQAFLDLLHRKSALEGELRVAASSAPGEFLLPPLLAEFTRLHPGVRPQVFISDSSEVTEEVAQHRWDLGFVGMQGSARSLRYDVVGHDEVVLAAPATHPLAARGEVRIADLEGQAVIEREAGSGTFRSFKRALAQAGLRVSYRPVMVLNSTHAILTAVGNGLGIGIVSSLEFGGREPERVRMLRIVDLPVRRTLYIVRSRHRPLPPVAAGFAEWVLEHRADG